MVMFPPPTATRCVPLSDAVVVAVPVVAAVSPSTEVEAIAFCVNNKAGAQIDAMMMRMIIAAMRTDPALNEFFIKNLKGNFHLRDHLEITYFISHFSDCAYASKVTAAMEKKSCSNPTDPSSFFF